MPKGLRKPMEEMPLEGSGGGAGGGGGARARLDAMTPKERAEMEKIGEQFRVKPAEAKAIAKIRARSETMTPQERAEMEKIGEQFRIKPEGMKRGGDVSASKRADGCAQRGKTKGRMV